MPSLSAQYAAYLLDESEDKPHSPLEGLLIHRMTPDTQMWDDVLQVIVQRIILRRELGEEEFGEIRDALIGIFETFRHLPELAFDFDHPVQDEVGEHHQGVLLDHEIGVGEALVQSLRILICRASAWETVWKRADATYIIDHAAETHSNIPKRDDDVAPYHWILARLQDLE